MGFDDTTSPTLVLGLGFPPTCESSPPKKPKESSTTAFEPSLTLGFSGTEKVFSDDHNGNPTGGDLYRQDSGGSVSTLSNVSVKREREFGSEEMGRNISSKVSNEEEEEDDGSNGRKKLRLTKAQSALLEESFKNHITLNPKRKQELARELNLRPRQVEVWFQNRRARTKLKQTELDCDYLKKCCETLKDENRRLHKEMQQLRALKSAQPIYRQFPVAAAAATLTMCPSCERIGSGVGENGSKISPFTMTV